MGGPWLVRSSKIQPVRCFDNWAHRTARAGTKVCISIISKVAFPVGSMEAAAFITSRMMSWCKGASTFYLLSVYITLINYGIFLINHKKNRTDNLCTWPLNSTGVIFYKFDLRWAFLSLNEAISAWTGFRLARKLSHKNTRNIQANILTIREFTICRGYFMEFRVDAYHTGASGTRFMCSVSVLSTDAWGRWFTRGGLYCRNRCQKTLASYILRDGRFFHQ